ncbi:MAG: Arginine decarboxylase, partial [uncultured Thermomicrobiales bacterium]
DERPQAALRPQPGGAPQRPRDAGRRRPRRHGGPHGPDDQPTAPDPRLARRVPPPDGARGRGDARADDRVGDLGPPQAGRSRRSRGAGRRQARSPFEPVRRHPAGGRRPRTGDDGVRGGSHPARSILGRPGDERPVRRRLSRHDRRLRRHGRPPRRCLRGPRRRTHALDEGPQPQPSLGGLRHRARPPGPDTARGVFRPQSGRATVAGDRGGVRRVGGAIPAGHPCPRPGGSHLRGEGVLPGPGGDPRRRDPRRGRRVAVHRPRDRPWPRPDGSSAADPPVRRAGVAV